MNANSDFYEKVVSGNFNCGGMDKKSNGAWQEHVKKLGLE
jgi:hypothetical protein